VVLDDLLDDRDVIRHNHKRLKLNVTP